ncbi:MAG: carbon-nitrogen hydrolase family protein [Rhizobiaceae bacterium]
MSSKFTAACLQNNATPDVAHNIEVSLRLARKAVGDGAKLIATPEYFSGLETKNGRFLPAAFEEVDQPVLPVFAQAARELGVWFLLGSLGVTGQDGRIHNRSYLLNDAGEITARYDKIHMFDVNLDGGSYRESATISPGCEAIVADVPWARLGLSICYDLRFGALYRDLAMAGADVLATPAAFTKVTGEAHWHVLQRARAIENGAFVIAPCQYGEVTGGGECYGHSLIVDPWGTVLSDAGDGEGYAIAELDMEQVVAARNRIPSLQHAREFRSAGHGGRPISTKIGEAA